MSNLFNEVTDMKKTDIILLTGLIGSIIFSNFAGFEKKLDRQNAGFVPLVMIQSRPLSANDT